MLCQQCGIPLIPVYEPTQGWVQRCARCQTFTDSASLNYDTESGQRSYLAYTKYLDGLYAEAQKMFLGLADIENDDAWKIACLWGALLSRYGIDYTPSQGYSIHFWRMDLPDYLPIQSSEWKRLYELIAYAGCRESVMPQMDAIQSQIKPLLEIKNSSWKVFILNTTEADHDLPSSLTEKIANQLMSGSPRIDCFFPQMRREYQQTYAAALYTAIRTCDVMIVVTGEEQILEDGFFNKEIRKFWQKCGNDSSRIMLCTYRYSCIDDILPRWMIDQRWPARWMYDDINNNIDYLAGVITSDIRNILSRLPIHLQDLPDLDAIYQSIVGPIKANKGLKDDSWVPQAEMIWNKYNDDRFGALLLGYYRRVLNRDAALECYNRLRQSNSKIANKAINAPFIQSFIYG